MSEEMKLADELLAFGQKLESASRIDMHEIRVIHRAYAKLRELSAELTRLRADLAAATATKDAAYLERNQCVSLIARMALELGLPACRARTTIEGWSEDWHGCVYIQLPSGQISWHYHDSQSDLFDYLPEQECAWDGHDTPEKYRRVLNPDLHSRLEITDERVERAARAWCEADPHSPDPDAPVLLGMKTMKAWEARAPIMRAALLAALGA